MSSELLPDGTPRLVPHEGGKLGPLEDAARVELERTIPVLDDLLACQDCAAKDAEIERLRATVGAQDQHILHLQERLAQPKEER